MQPMPTRQGTPSRARYHHGDLRNALLSAALKLIARKGVEAFSLREAARAVGVSAAAAYRHFEDRAALLATLALEGMARLAAAMEEAIGRTPGAPGTPARAAGEFAAIGLAYVEFAVANPSHFRIMFGPWCDHPALDELPPELFPGGRDPFQLLVDTLDGLVQAGVIPAAARQGAEIASWAGVHGVATLLVEGSLRLDAAERSQAFAGLIRTLLVGLGASPAVAGVQAGGPLPAARADPRAAMHLRGGAPKPR